ncbi:hypothetical protein LY76DRAFT_645559 [Colletotrichum caudatum]|nr:hypothetical protein LY76DRAFT_645559 [Colletotrichum caudatum]
MRLTVLAALLSTTLAGIVAGLALPLPGARLAVGGGEERQNAKFPKEIDLMEELAALDVKV